MHRPESAWFNPGAPLNWLVPLAGLCLAGCRGPQPLDNEVALQSLQQGLSAWQAGQRPESLKAATPAIVFGDVDWDNGTKLASFHIRSQHSDGSNLHAEVELTLADAARKSRQTTVTYIVGTRPVITVFRE